MHKSYTGYERRPKNTTTPRTLHMSRIPLAKAVYEIVGVTTNSTALARVPRPGCETDKGESGTAQHKEYEVIILVKDIR